MIMAQGSINVTIKLFAIYQEVYGITELIRQFPLETTVSEVLSLIIEEHPQLQKWQSITRFSVNYQFVEADTKLQDGDELVFIPPVSGG